MIRPLRPFRLGGEIAGARTARATAEFLVALALVLLAVVGGAGPASAYDVISTASAATTHSAADLGFGSVSSPVGATRFNYDSSHSRVATNTAGLADDAASAAQGARLREHLRLSEQYGAGGVRELADGRIRYYGQMTTASKPGPMAGARLVREWDHAAGSYRTWYETLDHVGQIRQVHPYQPYSSFHYVFDEFGNYVGRR